MSFDIIMRGAIASAKPIGGGSPFLLDYSAGTFTRTGEASRSSLPYPDIADAWQWHVTDSPRIYSDGSVLLEGARTNLAARSEEFDDATWAKVGASVTPDTDTAPDGDADADTIDIVVGSNARRIEQTVSGTSDGQTAAMSLYARHASGTTNFRLAIVKRNGAADFSSDFALTTAYQRFAFVNTVGTGGSDPIARIQAELAGNTGPFFGAGYQIEVGAFPTSYIRTTTGAGTRFGESLTFASIPAQMRSGSWSIDIWPSFASTEAPSTAIVLQLNSGTTRIDFTAGRVRVLTSGALSVQSNALTWSRHQKLTVSFDAAAGSVTVTGATTGDGTVVGSSWSWPDVDVRWGATLVGTGEFFGRLSRPVSA